MITVDKELERIGRGWFLVYLVHYELPHSRMIVQYVKHLCSVDSIYVVVLT